MRLIEHIKKNNGSTLTMVLFLLFLLSVTAIAVITITGSELSMSVMTSDRSKALMVAQAGAEKAAQVLDKAVAQKQEDARVKASEVIQSEINALKNTDIAFTIIIPEASPFFGVIDNSELGLIKIVNETQLNEIYYGEYKYWFNKKINEWLSVQKAIGGEWNIAHDISTVPADGKFSYVSVEPNEGAEALESLDISQNVIMSIKAIMLTSIGEYKSLANGSTYKRSIEAKFGLLTESRAGTDQDIPVAYGQLTKVRVNNNDKPIILQEKALIAQKDIISVGGNVNVTGNAICIGTIPTYAQTADKYKLVASGYDFGGLMAGITTSVWGNGEGSLKESIKNTHILNITDDSFFTNYTGSFKINGSLGTLAYVHNLYSLSGAPSKITVTGDTFARGVKVENRAHYSQSSFNNVYISDDLKIDANNAIIKIGNWNNDDPARPKSQEDVRLVGLNTGKASSVNSSSVAVSGDSKLYINGKVYMGGSTYYNEYTTDSDEMYVSGMSIQKSGSMPAVAFEMSGIDITPEPNKDLFPGNVFFYYDNNNDTNGVLDEEDYIAVNDQEELVHKLITKSYLFKSDAGNTDAHMMTGSTGLTDPFDILNKAMHFKWIWDKFWKEDIGYYSHLNTGDITITTTTTIPVEDTMPINYNGDLRGWCPGAVGANNKVYGPYGDVNASFSESYSQLTTEMQVGKTKYTDWMKLFVDSENELTATIPPKLLLENTNKPAVSELLQNGKFIETNSKSFMYYSLDNVVLSNIRVGNNFGSTDLTVTNGYISGIVYSDKDIYVKAGTKFKGILIAEGNIVFLGNADIEYDEDVVDILLSKTEINKFFKYSASDIMMNDQSAIIQTVKKADTKNIKIVSWKEI